MLNALEQNCHNLRDLNVSGNHCHGLIEDALEKTRGRLLSLFTSAMDLSAVARNCTGLRKLHLFRASSSIFDALRVVGPTLEELFGLDQVWTGRDFEQFQHLCSELSSIELGAEGDDDLAAYADFLCS